MTTSPSLSRRLGATALAAITVTALTSASTPGALAGTGSAAAVTAAASAKPIAVRLISFNDLHGNLEPPAGSSGRVVQDDGTTVDAGGAAFLATHVKQLRAAVTHSLVVSAGDSIGGSPLVSAAFHDEPTIEVLNSIGVKTSAVGNHEFDEGLRELQRIQFGGCHADGCTFRSTYKGAKFPFLGANVRSRYGVQPFASFTIRRSGGVPIGIIGVTLKELPTVVTRSAIEGLTFGDEVKAINRTSTMLDRLGVKAQVVLMHQGDEAPTGAPNDCKTESNGAATRIARAASAKVDVFFTAHTHQQYSCQVKDPAGHLRPVIQGLSFGRLLSVVDLKISRRTHDVIRSRTTAKNVVVTRTVKADPAVQKIVDRAHTRVASVANRKVGTITKDLNRVGPASGETPLGDVIADAQLESTAGNGAQVAITNPGGIRADLTYASSAAQEGAGVVTYGEAFSVQPFSNILQTITLTGAQLDAVLEQQWQPNDTRILQISSTLHYTMNLKAAVGSRVSGITVAGKPVTSTGSYRVTVNNFLAGGGDGFTTFTKGTNLAGGPIDLDAFVVYLTKHSPVSPSTLDRIKLA